MFTKTQINITITIINENNTGDKLKRMKKKFATPLTTSPKYETRAIIVPNNSVENQIT